MATDVNASSSTAFYVFLSLGIGTASALLTVVPLHTWVLISNFKVSYHMLRRPDGTFERDLAEYMDRRVPANPKPVEGVSSFDHVIDPSVGLEARIYRAGAGNAAASSGYFDLYSFSFSLYRATVHLPNLCRQFVKLSKGVVVSVNYRRAPEHRYPCAYDDGWAALKWAQAQPFLRSGEGARLRVFLAGDSSGGNIAHHVAVRAAEEGIKIHGNILLNAMFGGNERTESERRLDGKYFVTLQDRDWYWKADLPEDAGREHPARTPFGPHGRRLKGLPFAKSLIIVSGLDLTCDRQLGYAEGLREDGHDGELVASTCCPTRTTTTRRRSRCCDLIRLLLVLVLALAGVSECDIILQRVVRALAMAYCSYPFRALGRAGEGVSYGTGSERDKWLEQCPAASTGV
uniref:Gibberellin receptor GID1 n=1 Tax=Aegilops tauschii TaxID=37682 RepID=M8BLP9_AEGTA